MEKCLIIIPAYNEEKNIGKAIDSIQLLPTKFDILVVNDGSSDMTALVARQKNCYVLSLPFNLGYGGALQTGFKYAVKMGYDFVIQFDADNQHNAGDIESIYQELRKKASDIIIGSRFLGECSYKIGALKTIAINIFRIIINVFTKNEITDPTSGIKGLARPVFSYYSKFGNFPDDFPDADILIKMLFLGYKVKEIPATINRRDTGVSMHSGIKPVYYFMKILLCILIVILSKNSEGRV